MNESESQLLNTWEMVTKQMAAGVARFSRDFRYLWANQAYANWIQRPLNEIVDHPILEVLGKDAFEALLPHFHRVLTGETVRYEQETNFRGIGLRWTSAAYTPTLDASAAVNGWVAVVVDITERMQAEKTLRESEEWLRLAIQAGKMYAYEWDATTDVLVRSPEYVNVLAPTEPRTLTHQQAMEKIHPDDRPKLISAIARHSPKNPTVDVTYRVLLPGRAPVWVKSSGRAFFDGEGRMLRVVGIVADVTDQRLAEEALRASEERLRLAQKVAGIGSFERDIRTGVNTWTVEMESMYGLPPGGFGRTRTAFENLIHPDDRALVKKLVDEALRTGQAMSGEWRVIWPDESVHWIAGRWQALMDDSGGPLRVLGVNIDITERKRAEEAIRESEQRFRLVADSAPVMIWMSGLDKRPTYFNRLWLTFTGQSETDLMNGLAGIVHPEDYQKCHESYCQGFEKRQPFRKECRLRRHDGQYRWMVDIGMPRFHEDGSFAGYIGSCVDITEQKLAEEALSSISGQLIETQERERTRIARELHDDINQRLALVAMSLDRQSGDLHSTAKEMRSVMRNATKQISDLVSDVHLISHRLHSSKLDTVGLAAAAAGFCRELSKQKNVAIDFQCDGIPKELPEAIGLCMFRVLQEALQNAARHSGANHFKVRLAECSNQIALTICDEGRGFDPAEAQKGSGLGLASMMERLKLVGGELLIDAGPKGGTTIRASVPFTCQSKSKSADI
jgi:PAS domain S-box-containing protein